MKFIWILLGVYLVFGLIHQNKGKTYGYKIDFFIDLFFGAVIWCEPGVSISSETGLACQRAHPPFWATSLSAFLDLFKKGHCQKAIFDDIARAQHAIEYLRTKQP
jgi:hypothetical protein